MTTERLYYSDSYTLAFDALVTEHTTYKGHPAVLLDRTYFYPEGGGQPPDTGTINGVPVLDVQTRASDQAVVHILDQALPETPERTVRGVIDAARRFDHMRHHTGQHILSKALEVTARADTLSVHMSADSMTLDLNCIDISPEAWATAEDLANRVVLENRPVRAWFPEAAELATLSVRKMPDVAGKVRIVDVGGFDVTACGGTHVAHTGEVGLIKVVKAERRGNATRLEFKCGERALRDYREKNDVINRLMAAMTVGYWELDDALARLRAENKTLRSALNAAREELAEAEAMVMISAAPLYSDRRVVARAFEGRSVEEVRLLAQKIVSQPGTVALLGVPGEKAQLIFGRAEDLSLDMVLVLKKALAALGADRGGGRPDFAQGGGTPATLSQLKKAIREAEQFVMHS